VWPTASAAIGQMREIGMRKIAATSQLDDVGEE
jgi:hypothetical protein